jgi:hypothetical protein
MFYFFVINKWNPAIFVATLYLLHMNRGVAVFQSLHKQHSVIIYGPLFSLSPVLYGWLPDHPRNLPIVGHRVIQKVREIFRITRLMYEFRPKVREPQDVCGSRDQFLKICSKIFLVNFKVKQVSQLHCTNSWTWILSIAFGAGSGCTVSSLLRIVMVMMNYRNKHRVSMWLVAW